MAMLLKKPFQIGSLTLPSNIFCSPLAGCSDLPFRKMTGKYQPGIHFCEMVKMDALVRKNAKTFELLEYEPSMHPIGGQVCGSKPEIAGESAKIIEDLGFDIVDLNCGCPVDKVTKDGSGSGLLKYPERIGEIINNMVSAVKIPVTVKIRVGWDMDSIVAPQVTKIAEEAGAAVISIHGRTREQAYRGAADWSHIRECKKAAKKILVIGNGDIFTPQKAEEIFIQTSCDGILLSRGLMGQPWLIEDIYRHFEKQPPIKRSGKFLKEIFMEHFEYTLSYREERKALLDLRRISCWYLKERKGVRKLKEQLFKCKAIHEIKDLIQSFDWEEAEISQEVVFVN